MARDIRSSFYFRGGDHESLKQIAIDRQEEECGRVTESQEWKSLTCGRNNNSNKEEDSIGEDETVREMMGELGW